MSTACSRTSTSRRTVKTSRSPSASSGGNVEREPGAGRRRALLVCGIAVALLAGALQAGSWGLVGDRAVSYALPQRIPYATGAAIDLALAHIPGFGGLRSTVAAAAIRHGDLAIAAQLVDQLDPAARIELQARIDDRRGRYRDAVREYLAAGDVDAVTASVDRLDASGRAADARALEAALVERLGTIEPPPESYAEALWRLGTLESELAYIDAALRPSYERKSLADFEAAIAQRPLSEKYLLNAGNAAMRIREFNTAERYFRRTLEVDPKSASGHAALASLALERGRPAEARVELHEALRLGPNDPDVRRLEAKIEGRAP